MTTILHTICHSLFHRRLNSILRTVLVATGLSLSLSAFAQESGRPAPRHIGLQEAVQLALHHNHVVRIAEYKTEEKQHAREVARSAYLPTLSTNGAVLNVTDTQFIGIGAGSLGRVNGTPIPERTAVINQGGNTFYLSQTSLTQPLTQLFKIRRQNDIAVAEARATREQQQETENTVALQVHQLYYRILIEQIHQSATEARIQANQDLEGERVQQVKYGSSLDQDLIESRAQLLQAKQELLTSQLRLSDFTLQFNDAVGLPLATPLVLETDVPPVDDICPREECVKTALAAHPEIREAQDEVNKANAAVKLAKADYIPDVTAIASYSYQDNVPFLARNFGTFGFRMGYDLFDGGRKRATLREHESQLAQAKENLARVTEDIELEIQTAYNKLERTREMVKVSQELLSLRTESRRVSAQQMERGAALKSQADSAVAQEFDAKTALLQAQLDFVESRDELIKTMGQIPQ